jgi:hypothetical protein
MQNPYLTHAHNETFGVLFLKTRVQFQRNLTVLSRGHCSIIWLQAKTPRIHDEQYKAIAWEQTTKPIYDLLPRR